MATENMTQTERQRVFPDYFEKCNVLGWEFAQNVTEMIRLYGKYDDAVVRIFQNLKFVFFNLFLDIG